MASTRVGTVRSVLSKLLQRPRSLLHSTQKTSTFVTDSGSFDKVTAPTVLPNPQLLIAQLKALAEDPDAFSDYKTEIQDLAGKADVAFDDPIETMGRTLFSSFSGICAYIGQEHHIFETLVEAGDSTTSFEVLVEKSGIDGDVLHPILDYMGCKNMIQEVSTEQYKATRITKNLVSPMCVGAMLFGHTLAFPAWSSFHNSIGPGADERTPFQIAHRTNGNIYALLQQYPAEMGGFHRCMQGIAENTPSWLTKVQFDEEFALKPSPSTAETVLFVDIGGGNGHQCTSLVETYPDLAGRIILEDQPPVLANSTVTDRVEKISYNYFTEQPVQGARAYYIRQVLHNSDDETCLRILKSQLSALGSTSVLLIDDKVIPDEKVPGAPSLLSATEFSLTMFAMFRAVERRESHWRRLLDKAGYKISAINRYSDNYDCIIFATKK